MRTVWRRGGLSTIHRSDSQGAKLLTLAADTPRIERVEIRSHTVECLRSSPAFLQRLLHTEDLSQEPWEGGASVTPNVVIAPDGELTGNRVADNDPAGNQALTQEVSYTPGEWVRVSSFLRKRPNAPTFRLIANFRDGTSERWPRVDVDPETGDFLPHDETGDVEILYGHVESVGDWWLVELVARSNEDHATVRPLVEPAVGPSGVLGGFEHTTGFNDIWGVNLVKSAFRLPYREAGDSPVSHPGDEPYFAGWPVQLRDTLLYVDGFAFGARSSDEGNPRLFTVGDRSAVGTVTASLVHTPGGALQLHVHDVADWTNAVSGLTLPPEGGPFEAVCDFDRSGGAIRLYAQVGETAGVGAPVSADLSGDWNSDKLRIGHYLDSIFVHEPASVGHYRHLAVDRAAVPPGLLADAEGLIAHLRDAAGRFGTDGKLLAA